MLIKKVLLTLALIISVCFSNIKFWDGDNIQSLGLNGIPDSLGYKVTEIENHIHNAEQWVGSNSGTPSTENIAAFAATSGAINTFGAYVTINSGTTLEGGSSVKKFDLHRLLAFSSTTDQTFLLELRYGTGFVGTSTLLTRVPVRFGGVLSDAAPFEIIAHRITCNNKVWARVKCTQATQSLNFIYGVHIYNK